MIDQCVGGTGLEWNRSFPLTLYSTVQHTAMLQEVKEKHNGW
ncbi:MAG TPA: hypothetical protein VMU30_10620 [Bacteroidota bacterium]|nr:hypothetical protein [Bacteroidota bacterium]